MIHTADQLKALCRAERRAMINQIDYQGKRVIDIGCGDGRFTLPHFADASTILGLDPKQEEIDGAIAALQSSETRNPSNTHFLCADIVDYPVPEDSLDIAIFLRSF